MEIITIPIAEIRIAPYNPRKDLTPSDPEYQQLLASIDAFGFVEPLVWNRRTGTLVGGHQRLKILKERGETAVEVSVVDMDIEEEQALNIALNKIAGDWDVEQLRMLIEPMRFDLQQLTGVDLDNDLIPWTGDWSDVEGKVPADPAAEVVIRVRVPVGDVDAATAAIAEAWPDAVIL